MIQYHVNLIDPGAHLIEVSLSVQQANPEGQAFSMARWVPGSYLIRELAKNVIEVRAFHENKPIKVQKTNNQRWLCEAVSGPLTLVYTVYAADISVRGAHFDRTHAFFDGARLFMSVEGQEQLPCQLTIQLPNSDQVQGEWQVATSMRRVANHFEALNFEALIDHPFEMGVFEEQKFDVKGIPHTLMVSGKHYGNTARLCEALEKICAYQHQLFGAPVPIDRYVFLLSLSHHGHGGLEHCFSCACQASRYQMPAASGAYSEGTIGLLGLLSHEYFHLWNVKRIKPEAFLPYSLSDKGLTRQLWAFEGITAYYDDLSLLRSGVISLEAYLKLLSKTISQLYHGDGHLKQSVTDASLDAWIKFYQPDENSVNATVSYYIKGSLVALCIDLRMRQLSAEQYSLDTVMRALWERYGAINKGVPEGAIEQLIIELVGSVIVPELQEWLYEPKNLPLVELLGTVGIDLKWEEVGKSHTLGLQFEGHGSHLKVSHVFTGGPAHRSGVAAGDTLVALDGLMLSESSYKQLSEQIPLGLKVPLEVFRDDRLLSFEIAFERPASKSVTLSLQNPEGTPRWLSSSP